MKNSGWAAGGSLQGDQVRDAPRRARQAASPPIGPEEQRVLQNAEYRLGVKKFGNEYVETLLFIRAGGIEVGYYTIHFDVDGSFVDFTSYDEETEVRAVYECFTAFDDGKALTEVLEQDLCTMGYYIPELRGEINDFRLTCKSCGGCGSYACAMDCPLQVRYRPASKE